MSQTVEEADFFRSSKQYGRSENALPAFFLMQKNRGRRSSRLAIRSFSEGWWNQTDLNRRPGDYESPALTD